MHHSACACCLLCRLAQYSTVSERRQIQPLWGPRLARLKHDEASDSRRLRLHSQVEGEVSAMKRFALGIAAIWVICPGVLAADAPPSGAAHARTEFAKYASQLVGKPATIDAEGVCSGRNCGCLCDRPVPLIDALVGRPGQLRVPSDLGDEGFLIKSVDDGGRRCVVILGGSPRGTLYGVYRYLEHFCRVGFFWDGEHVPRLPSLPTAGIDVVERPRWPMRQYMMDCEYTSYWWDWDQWKAEVDWAAKHRFNVLSSNFDFTATWRAVWKRFGVDVPPTSLSAPPFHPWAGWHKWAMRPPYPVAYQDFQADLAQRFTEYGRSVGLKMAPDFHGFIGQVPREFAEAYRGKARFLEVRWVGFDPPGVFLHPDDPLYLQVAKAFAEEYLQRFGTDHLWASQSYCEMRPSTDPQGDPGDRDRRRRKEPGGDPLGRSAGGAVHQFLDVPGSPTGRRDGIPGGPAGRCLPGVGNAQRSGSRPAHVPAVRLLRRQAVAGRLPVRLRRHHHASRRPGRHGATRSSGRGRSPGREVPRAVHRAGGDPSQPASPSI